MFDVFGKLGALLKIDPVSIDNITFRFHYKVTMIILVTFSLLVTSRQYFGDPISCIGDDFETEAIDVYCWIQSTFTIPALTGAIIGVEVAHPGVASLGQAEEQYVVRHHKYYQWVTLFLFLQAIMFYMPRYLWKCWEGGRVKALVENLNTPVVAPEEKKERLHIVLGYFSRYFHYHDLYAYQFFLCEIMNFVNVVGQIYFTDRFLDYGFSTYGTRVLEFTEQELGSRHDPMDEIFPKVAKCTFHRFGPSGTIMRHDVLCVLPLNILNEKIFVFLWFWFIIVAVISGCGLVYRMATFSSSFRHLLLRGRSRLALAEQLDSISRKCQIGDWFLLYLLAKNMDPYIYKDFIRDLDSTLPEKDLKA
ncbi:innexin inx2-like [Penaeus japonicus]|uniref:innexin inx2-like n=1 Tax=Penaeus japonicus TaxID=27405 RepID=UPI001C711B15|nr:innexin inx2-like [Penaeus japonicus]